jgi:outer membrane protein OmpA-like peptidoglycan-associated protein
MASDTHTNAPVSGPSQGLERWPFAPWGLAPLLGLLALGVIALGPFAFGEVQAATEASARRALADIGADWAKAEISGQWVTLVGKPPSREAAARAVSAVRQAKSPTLFGDAAPATAVFERFTWAEDTLVPSSGGRPAIGAATGPAPSDEQVASCDKAMSAVLAGATIEFSTASTSVSAASDKLLDAIVLAAGDCSGVLRIEGHTDDVGRSLANTRLSRQRAEAVRAALIARGVPAGRLLAEGFGSSKPVADNKTVAGRARNRRIEIHAVRAGSPP